jgi:glutaminase
VPHKLRNTPEITIFSYIYIIYSVARKVYYYVKVNTFSFSITDLAYKVATLAAQRSRPHAAERVYKREQLITRNGE